MSPTPRADSAAKGRDEQFKDLSASTLHEFSTLSRVGLSGSGAPPLGKLPLQKAAGPFPGLRRGAAVRLFGSEGRSTGA